MRFGAVFALLLLAPSVAWGATELELSQPATVGGKTFPLQAVVTATTSEVILSDEKIEGAVPVTITFYIAPKPKPKPQATSSQIAAAIQSSEGIQDAITGVSPAVGSAVEPFFTLVDGGRQKAADTLGSQLQGVKADLGSDAGNILGAEATKDAASNPMGTLWFILKTLYIYVLTILLFLISNAGVFYPLIAIVFLYVLWRVFKRFRRH
jgi:hypothetical protein